jgi:anti-sigma B factor antagonist
LQADVMTAYRRITTSDRSGVIVVRFTESKITDAGRIEELGRELTNLIVTERPGKILLNFDKVDYLSSEALRVFLLLNKKVQTQGSLLKLCSVAPEIWKVFEITGLNKVFDVYATEVDALCAF